AEDVAATWRVPDLADRVGVSVPHLHRLFADQLGMSPMAWLDRTRVERATSYLLGSTLSVGRIGARVGWPDPNHFSRRFRALTGRSPSDYRRRFAPRHRDRSSSTDPHQ
ncbi:MAG TPA: helix-turn-helix transcriptional regulator, partial [Candidatus Avipropionibacterium avicola]|nr:helix-turn-helix transcriptional regulator [Candidatus Avipropionibacterium avicola]